MPRNQILVFLPIPRYANPRKRAHPGLVVATSQRLAGPIGIAPGNREKGKNLIHPFSISTFLLNKTFFSGKLANEKGKVD